MSTPYGVRVRAAPREAANCESAWATRSSSLPISCVFGNSIWRWIRKASKNFSAACCEWKATAAKENEPAPIRCLATARSSSAFWSHCWTSSSITSSTGLIDHFSVLVRWIGDAADDMLGLFKPLCRHDLDPHGFPQPVYKGDAGERGNAASGRLCRGGDSGAGLTGGQRALGLPGDGRGAPV